MPKNENSDEGGDDEADDKQLFRDAMSDATPLQHEARATSPRSASPRARFSREEQQKVLRESMEADYDERDIHSADNLRYNRATVGKRTMR